MVTYLQQELEHSLGREMQLKDVIEEIAAKEGEVIGSRVKDL